ncbi:Cbr1 protein [Elysia marginata]|uniref:Cbr1 protein n=1 Tax=Elysia marginata TaxID=1093978 RepID=A0AAV4H467_9GAST|nr:Cbr1 protein [Elysia marginata]
MATASDVAAYLNQLGGLGMRDIAANDNLLELINDFFMCEADDGEEESSLSEESGIDLTASRPQTHPSYPSPRHVPSDTGAEVESTAPEPPERPIFEDVDQHLEFMELTKQEMDIAITAQLSSCMRRDPTTTRSKKGTQTERKATRTDYLFGEHPVYRDFSLHVHCISEKVLKNIIAHYKTNGVSARPHGLSQKLPHNALS